MIFKVAFRYILAAKISTTPSQFIKKFKRLPFRIISILWLEAPHVNQNKGLIIRQTA